MSKNLSFFSLSMPIILAAAILSFAGTAQAGFEWRGTAPAAAAPVAGDLPAPVIMWDGTSPDAPPALMPAEKIEPVTTMPVAPAPAMTATPVYNAQPAVAEELVSGFGSDMPLAIALQQVVPPGHQFSFASGVDAGTTVSWQGGKSWRDVLTEMLDSKGLTYKNQNNVIVIAPAGAFSAPAPVAQQGVVWDTPNTSGVEQVPVENAAAVPAADTAPVNIRRQKPSTLLGKIKRMTQTSSKEEGSVQNIAVPRAPEETAPTTAPTPDAPVQQSLPPVDLMPMSVTKAPVVSEPQLAPLAVTPGRMNQDMTSSAQPMLSAPTWHGATGQTLRDVLKNWSDVAGVELYWSIDYDYRLEQDFAHNGTYDEAVGGVLDKFAAARPQPYGQLHQSGDSPRVLVVKSYDLIP
jgi:hypothetical protein